MRSISSGDAMQLETGTQPDTSSFIILDASASGTDEGSNILFEDATGDPSKLFTDNTVFNGSVKIGSATITEDTTNNQLKINDQDKQKYPSEQVATID